MDKDNKVAENIVNSFDSKNTLSKVFPVCFPISNLINLHSSGDASE